MQDPQEAAAPSMPGSALANVDVDRCVLLNAIAPLLVRLVATRTSVAPAPPPQGVVKEQALFEGRDDPMDTLKTIAATTQLTCPACGGTLSELKDARPLRYRCHTGHAYSALTLDSAQAEQTDHALQAGHRALKEREALLRRMAAVSAQIGDEAQASAGLQQADRVREQAERLAAMLVEEEAGTTTGSA